MSTNLENNDPSDGTKSFPTTEIPLDKSPDSKIDFRNLFKFKSLYQF